MMKSRVHPKRSSRLQRWLELARTAGYRTAELARLCNISVRQLERDFNLEMGRTPQDWLNEQRAIAARHLLLEGMDRRQILDELGFKQESQFSRDFKRYHGVTPRAFMSLHITLRVENVNAQHRN